MHSEKGRELDEEGGRGGRQGEREGERERGEGGREREKQTATIIITRERPQEEKHTNTHTHTNTHKWKQLLLRIFHADSRETLSASRSHLWHFRGTRSPIWVHSQTSRQGTTPRR